jgi:hypothetical protein
MAVAGKSQIDDVERRARAERLRQVSVEKLQRRLLDIKLAMLECAIAGDDEGVYIELGKLLRLPPWRRMFNQRMHRLPKELRKDIARLFVRAVRDNVQAVAAADSDLVKQFYRMAFWVLTHVPEEHYKVVKRALSYGQDRRTTQRQGKS